MENCQIEKMQIRLALKIAENGFLFVNCNFRKSKLVGDHRTSCDYITANKQHRDYSKRVVSS